MDLDETSLTSSETSSKGTANAVRRSANQAARLLGFDPLRTAVLLTSEWHVPEVPFAFEHMALYQEVADESNFVIVALSQPEAGGLEHLLFMARQNDLQATEYLACIDPKKRTFTASPTQEGTNEVLA